MMLARVAFRRAKERMAMTAANAPVLKVLGARFYARAAQPCGERGARGGGGRGNLRILASAKRRLFGLRAAREAGIPDGGAKKSAPFRMQS